jgi:PAS domain S-box-containing protein
MVRRNLVKNATLLSLIIMMLYFMSTKNYLLFHSIIEIVSIFIAFALFSFALNSREFNSNNYLLFLGIAYLFIGSVDFLHTLAYKNMNIFSGYDSNLPTQLWIFARYMEAISLVIASFFINKKNKITKVTIIVLIYLIITSLTLVSIFLKYFPVCFVEGSGLTLFKKVSEYIISIILLFAFWRYHKLKNHFLKSIRWAIYLSIIFTIFSEIAFTFYISVFGLSNFIGHIFKLLSFYLIYKALIVTNLKQPYKSLFRSLKESEEKYRKIVDGSIQGLVVAQDNPIRLSYVTKPMEAITGYSPEELMNFKPVQMQNLIYPGDRQRFFTSFKKRLCGEYTEQRSEYRIIKKDRSVSWVELFSSLIVYEGEKATQTAFVDITERKQAEEEIKKSRERLKMLNKIIRHDLANDFVVINSAINIFKRTSNVAMLDEITTRAEKSFKTIAGYRKYESFIDSNTDLEEIIINEVVNELIIEFPDVKINVEGKCKVFADDALYSIFKNLISNSILHGNSSKIDIKITSGTDTCEIKFIDNGTGIPDKIKSKIFDEGFYHGKAGHTGIGLHIVKKTIESYDGSVTVEDNEPSGAVFVINLKKVIT